MQGPAPTTDDSQLVDTWHRVLADHTRVSCALERTLRAHDLTPSEYEVLERLAGTDCDHRRMQDLAEGVFLSQSALSRVVGRLEDDGLVERAICKEDRRGIFVNLTAAGRARYLAALPDHRRILSETLTR
jgi:DNA-binding MarR family transcriptional regulator